MCVSDDPPAYTGRLKKIPLTIICSRTCDSRFLISPPEGQFCAESGSRYYGVYKGDSGGPLQCFKDNRWYQVGVVSAGRSYNAQRSTPPTPQFQAAISLFADVTHPDLHSWMKTIMA